MDVDKPEIERRMRAFLHTCRARGLKATHQRTEVFRQLAATQRHPDAETVYRGVRRRIPAISRDTVYRTLATLVDQGLIRRTEALGGSIRLDANLAPHHHFVCTVCGAIRDFTSQAMDDLPIPNPVRSFGRVESAQVQVRGICSDCLGRKARPPRRSALRRNS